MIQQDTFELFTTDDEFKQVYFLDNFYENVAVDVESPADLGNLLRAASTKPKSVYVRRSASIIFFDLALTGALSNSFGAIAHMLDLTSSPHRELQTLALKYLPYFPVAMSDDLVQKVKLLTGDADGDVSSQAYFCLGLAELTLSTLQSSTQDLLLKIIKAKKCFDAANHAVENRDDAEFWALFCKWSQHALNNDQVLSTSTFSNLKHVISHRILYEYSHVHLNLDYLTFKILNSLESSRKLVAQADQWLDVTSRIKDLFEISLTIEAARAFAKHHKLIAEKLYSQLFNTLQQKIYQIHLIPEKSRLRQIQSEDSSFQSFVVHLITLLSTQDQNQTDNPELLAILAENLGSANGLNVYRQIPDKTASSDVLKIISDVLQSHKAGNIPFRTGGLIGHEILEQLTAKIQAAVPDYPSYKMEIFSNLLEEVIRYCARTFTRHERSKFQFLFSKAFGGKGEDALEEDLQNDMIAFFEHSKVADGLDHEKAKFVDGGRVDIVYVKDGITIPIELKKSLTRPTLESIESNYISQAQTYTAGYDQLGIFVVIELSDKTSTPPPNMRDWFNIHHLAPHTALPVKFPDNIISVVIPGNRVLPSSKSTYGK
jgi:hypothetical protein